MARPQSLERNMGQGSLFGGWEATRLSVDVGFIPDKHSGWVTVTTHGVTGEALTSNTVSWRKERDLAGLPDLVKQVANSFLYGTPEDCTWALKALVSEHLTELNPAGQTP